MAGGISLLLREMTRVRSRAEQQLIETSEINSHLSQRHGTQSSSQHGEDTYAARHEIAGKGKHVISQQQ